MHVKLSGIIPPSGMLGAKVTCANFAIREPEMETE